MANHEVGSSVLANHIREYDAVAETTEETTEDAARGVEPYVGILGGDRTREGTVEEEGLISVGDPNRSSAPSRFTSAPVKRLAAP